MRKKGKNCLTFTDTDCSCVVNRNPPMPTTTKKAVTRKSTARKTTGSGQYPIHAALEQYFGFKEFKGTQEAAINSLLDGKDTFVIMPTGGGKSLCYQLPALMLDGTAIVVSPLIALMKNQVDAMRGFSDEDGVAHVINSSLNKTEIAQVKSD